MIQSQIEERVWELINKIHLKGKSRRASEKYRPDVSLVRDLGFDSTDALELIVEIEKEFDITIPDEHLKVELFDMVSALVSTVMSMVRKPVKA